MSQSAAAPSQKLVTELKVSGHLMTLEKGLFCVFHAPGSGPADPQTGLPGVRITHPPLQDRSRLSISGFSEDGWIGAEAGAALVRVNAPTAQLLVTIYQNGNGQNEAPRLQVMRLGDAAAAGAPAAPSAPVVAPVVVGPPPEPDAPPTPVEGAEVAAHVQRRGDRLGKLGEWMGEPGSQSWIEGFAIAPNRLIGPEDIEYQAVLGKGWLSPWSEGGQYCGSRGMALPILGLRVRLRGASAETHSLRVHATFTDGSRIGPVSDTEPAEAESLAPLEAFRIEILPHAGLAADEADMGEEDAAAPLPPLEISNPDGAPPVRVQPVKSEPVKAQLGKTEPAAVVPKPGVAKSGVAKPGAGKRDKAPEAKPGRTARR